MPQDRQSGAAASAWGRETAKKIARAIGATAPTGTSNECSLDGDRIVIKCAAAKTDQVGVTYNMLPRLSYVLGAFQRDDGQFDLYALDPKVYDANERPTRSQGRPAAWAKFVGGCSSRLGVSCVRFRSTSTCKRLYNER